MKDITLGQIGTAFVEYYKAVCYLIPPVVIILMIVEKIFG